MLALIYLHGRAFFAISRPVIPRRIKGFHCASTYIMWKKKTSLIHSRLTNTGGHLAAGIYACKMPLYCGAYQMAFHAAYTHLFHLFNIAFS